MLGGSALASGLVRIDEPFHGAVLNQRHGHLTAGGLKIRVSGEALSDNRVTVNGQTAERAGSRFGSDLVLRDRETEIIASSTGNRGRGEQRVRVIWDRHSYPRYRFSVDDNSFFLRDIAQREIMDLFTHEQYFWPFYRDHLPDHARRLDVAIRWVTEHGYKPVLFHEGFLGGPPFHEA